MATAGAARPGGAGRSGTSGRTAWGRRPVLFYAWLGLTVQLAVLIGAVVFVIVGAGYQGWASAAGNQAERLRVINAGLGHDFLSAQRAARGYLLTGQDQFLQSYYASRSIFADDLHKAGALAFPAVVGDIEQEGSLARASFTLTDQAVSLPSGARRVRMAARASALADRFTARNGQVTSRLSAVSRALAAASQRALGVGLVAVAAVLSVGLLIPVVAAAITLHWSLVPLRDAARTVRDLVSGSYAARATPGGPAEIYELGTLINVLAGESDRLRTAQRRRSRLSTLVRQTAARVRQHLDADGLIKEATRAIRENLPCDFVWVALVEGSGMTLPEGNPGDWATRSAAVSSLPADYLSWAEGLYWDRTSFCVQDLRSVPSFRLPPRVRDMLLGMRAASLLLTPFGVGDKLVGALILLRNDPGQRWTTAEITAVESLASDLGRGLDHARLYRQEKEMVGKLTELDRAKSDFLAAVSHDLRAPLTSITGYTELLDEDREHRLGEAEHRMLRAIDRNAMRLSDLIDDVLTMSKIETGAFETKLEPVDLASVVTAAAGDMQATAEEAGLELGLACPRQPVRVDGDAGQLDRAMTNLLSNAVKYTPSGGRVDVSLGQDHGKALVTVSDTGIGIPDEDQESLFTRFFRASNAVSRAVPGTGLGLAIVATIVGNHHGEITLRSKEGAGTTVVIRLPLAAGQAAST